MGRKATLAPTPCKPAEVQKRIGSGSTRKWAVLTNETRMCCTISDVLSRCQHRYPSCMNRFPEKCHRRATILTLPRATAVAIWRFDSDKNRPNKSRILQTRHGKGSPVLPPFERLVRLETATEGHPSDLRKIVITVEHDQNGQINTHQRRLSREHCLQRADHLPNGR